MNNKKKKVIGYLHSHWDREWYSTFETFRLRLLKVFDNIVDMLKNGDIPSFYFDGQTAALLDYLELRPEKEPLIRQLIKDKKLFIGPFYCLVDEFMTDYICFKRNIKMGLETAIELGCKDFVAYFADTFGHSQNISHILKEFNIDKAIVWRGAGDLPSEFLFNGIKTVNLVRGYFNDIFAQDIDIKEKAEFLKKNLDLIAEKSSDVLLLPIGADHLGIPNDIMNQIKEVNEYLEDYEIEISSIFEYFKKVKFSEEFNGELRDNSKTFILPGCYSARTRIKQLNIQASYKLDIADKIQYNFGSIYETAVNYAYKLLLQNQAHDSICGCSLDEVHEEVILRYKKVLQIADYIINDIASAQQENLSITFKHEDKYKILEVERDKIDQGAQVISTRKGFPNRLLHNPLRIPVTEDYTTLYTQLKEFNNAGDSDLKVSDNMLENSNIRLEIKDGKINITSGKDKYNDILQFVRYNDLGDTYNYGPDIKDTGIFAEIISSKIIEQGPLRCGIKVTTSFFSISIYLKKRSKLLEFRIKWNNILSNKLWQARINLKKTVTETFSEDLNLLIHREFDPDYDIRKNLPNSGGHEAKTNTAPLQRFVWAQGVGIITKGLTEYEVFKNTLNISLLRSIGVISNPNNPARTTPAGPPLKVIGAQQFGENTAEFYLGVFDCEEWATRVEDVYPQTVIF